MNPRFSKLLKAIREFWERDYRSDVQLLNRSLSRDDSRPAGFEEVPPSVLTGDPLALESGACIIVIGKNPSYPGRPGDVDQARAEHSDGRFNNYQQRRSLFFADSDPHNQYNWRHFSRLGNLISKHILGLTMASPRATFREHVAVVDLLPWWSKNTANIDPRKLRASLEPLIIWRELLKLHIDVLEPTKIIIHGSGFIENARVILDTELRRFDFMSPQGYRGVAYSGRTGRNTPVLAHAQVTAKCGPGNDDAYAALISQWPLRA